MLNRIVWNHQIKTDWFCRGSGFIIHSSRERPGPVGGNDVSRQGDCQSGQRTTQPTRAESLKIVFSLFLLDTPCTAGARSAIDWSERVKNGEQIGRRCTENWLQRIIKLHFYFDLTPPTSIRWFSKIQKVRKRVVQNRVPER